MPIHFVVYSFRCLQIRQERQYAPFTERERRYPEGWSVNGADKKKWSAHNLWGTDWSRRVEYDSARKEGTMYVDGWLKAAWGRAIL